MQLLWEKLKNIKKLESSSNLLNLKNNNQKKIL